MTGIITTGGDLMIKKEMIAMLLAGGQGSRLGVLTANVAKPAVAFGGKYRIIDFPLSNCINSGVDTVGVLTQSELVFRGTLTEMSEEYRFYHRMKKVQVVNGIQVQPMRFSRT